MDILGEYEKQRPAAMPAQAQWRYDPQSRYGFFIRLVMRLSGGKIENSRQASIVLLIAAAIILAVSVVIFARATGWFRPTPANTPVPIAGPGNSGPQNPQQP